MKRLPALSIAVRFVGLLAIVILGLVSIVGTGGGGGGGGYSHDFDGVYYHRDTDGDGYGDPNVFLRSTTQPRGYVSNYTDCNDTDPGIHPGARESFWDYEDNNCDGQVNEGARCTDVDGDGYYLQIGCGTVQDCDDTNADIHPDGLEYYCDGLDDNCNGLIDEGCVLTDMDGDGFILEDDLGLPVDCDDTRADVYPGAQELCGDGLDNNCDGQIDARCPMIPDTGQIICYNNRAPFVFCIPPGDVFYGQDAHYSINPPNFTKLDASGNDLPENAASWAMVKDNITGLIWEVKTDDDSAHNKNIRYTFTNAIHYLIAKFNNERFGGYSDWRLPTKKELLLLINYSTYGPALDTRYFSGAMASPYWSSTEHAKASALVWFVYFNYGLDSTIDKSSTCFVRAVRGEQLSPSFTDNGDGTVIDEATGLMWAKATAPTAMSWQDALIWCQNFSLAGYSDWRLPTIKELITIVDDEYDNYTAIDTSFFPDTVGRKYYWTSTTVAYGPAYAWRINFVKGATDDEGYKTGHHYVRAVRYIQ